MGKWFNENMSSYELGIAFFSIGKEEYEAHKEEIKKEYAEAVDIITDRESKLAAEGWML